MLRRLLVLLAAAYAAWIAPCTVAAPTPATPAAQVNALVDRYFEEQLKLQPVSATYLGDARYNDKYTNSLSPKFVAESEARERRYLKEIERIDPSSLEGTDRITYDVFKYDRESALAGVPFPGELLPIDQFNNPVSNFAVLGSGDSAQPFNTVKDYENFLKRSDEFLVFLDQAIVNMRQGVTKGVVEPKIVMQKVLPQLDDLVTPRVEDSIFYGPVKALSAKNFSNSDNKRLKSAYERAIKDKLNPALKRLSDYVRNDYLPHCRDNVGWSALPNGKAWYDYTLSIFTTTNMSAEEIHQLGLREVARIRGEMEEVRRQVGFDGDLHAFFRFMQTDPRFLFKSEDDALTQYRATKTRVDGLLPKLFKDFPRVGYNIKPVEAFRAASSAGAFYEFGSEDGSRPGVFYLNTSDLARAPIYGMETLTLHEGEPGHHFQITIAQGLKGLPRYRRYAGGSAYWEGWALYSESIGKELGLFTDPYQYYGRLGDEMLRAMRLVIDTGIHAKGWTREQSIAYMLDNSSMAESEVVAEVERYIAWPGQATSYKVGQLRIRAMRDRAEKAFGPRFDVKDFHSQILLDGALPMDVLDAKVDRWIAAQSRG
ncbi:MAG TPA: DUF885 domain-containing protein [Steroidobacteraceae bacterium]|nr:DUF885 domain-containing protein [Steroidobacteraceae bacterium]